jgi:hypothetical protein
MTARCGGWRSTPSAGYAEATELLLMNGVLLGKAY